MKCFLAFFFFFNCCLLTVFIVAFFFLRRLRREKIDICGKEVMFVTIHVSWMLQRRSKRVLMETSHLKLEVDPHKRTGVACSAKTDQKRAALSKPLSCDSGVCAGPELQHWRLPGLDFSIPACNTSVACLTFHLLV